MNKERDGWDALTQKAVARLLKNTYTPADFAKTFGIEIKGKADIFDALVKAGHAQNFAAALVMVATKMPPKGGHGWEELAEFTKALEDAPAVTSQPLAPQAVAKPRGQSFGR
jgi:dihydroxyacid dehydratase/phosphogluconate dehydratase